LGKYRRISLRHPGKPWPFIVPWWGSLTKGHGQRGPATVDERIAT
jgi:hypothetical protein